MKKRLQKRVKGINQAVKKMKMKQDGEEKVKGSEGDKSNNKGR